MVLKVDGSSVWRSWLPALAGLAALIALVFYFGGVETAKLLGDLGFGFFLVLLCHMLPLIADAQTWDTILGPAFKPKWHEVLILTWISQSINRFLPLANIGGEVVRVRLASVIGIPPEIAIASVVADVAIAAFTLILFALLGTSLSIIEPLSEQGSDLNDFSRYILVGFISMIAYLVMVVFIFRGGFLRRIGTLLRFYLSQRFFRKCSKWLFRVDMSMYKLGNSRWRLLKATMWRFVSWVAGAVEIWVVLWLLGYNFGFESALIIESLSQVIRSAAFFIPMALGFQEAGILLACSVAGVEPTIAITVALIRRAREFTIGLPAFGVWMIMERR